MQNQFGNSAFQQQFFNSQINRPEGCYQISPFGVTLQPISVRPNPTSISSGPNIPPTTPLSPPQATSIVYASQQNTLSLTPLSCGGFIYQPTYLPPQSPPQPPSMFTPPQPPSTSHFTANSPQFVSTEIAARQEKLEKYREKRAKRNYNRPVDQGKRDRACARSRDANGHFATESKREQERMRQALEASQQESLMLKSKLSNVEQELFELRQKAEEATAYKQYIQSLLDLQQHVNQDLLRENTLLWSTVPVDEVFSTINQTNPPVYLDAFKQKVDLSTIELNWTDSPHLEAARLEDTEIEQRWDDMSCDSFFAGARS